MKCASLPIINFLRHFAAWACALFFALSAQASFTNYNSLMLGDRAGGMGGAFTALTDDPAASAYYNPATLARLSGSSLSTSINLFNKYDVSYGSQEKLGDSIFRINKGSILSIPSASGIFSSFKNFTAGLSIVIPDYEVFGGDIHSEGQDTTFLRVNDESIWIGGAFAFNLDEKRALGLTVYYTSRTFNKSLTNRYDTGAETIVENIEKTFSTNAFVYILGYFQELSDKWKTGVSYRFQSIPVAGKGNYLESSIGTVSGAQPIVRDNNLNAETQIPDQLSWGIAFVDPRELTISLDVRYYGTSNYNDLDKFGDRMVHKETFNVALGYEKYLEPWLAMRLGLFTDFSASPEIPQAPTRYYQDHVDKFGFSANFGIHTTEHTMVSLGGYYLGGNGYAAERIGSGYQRISKTDRLFSFLVGSSYNF